MTVFDKFQDIKGNLPAGSRIMALDIGTKTVGIAVSDPGLSVATPVTTVRRTKFTEDIKLIARETEGRNIGAVILGLPLNTDGSEGPKCQSVREFARNLERNMTVFPAPFIISFFDERFSTAASHRFMIDDFDLSRKKREKVIDKMAAQHILQGALDTLSGL